MQQNENPSFGELKRETEQPAPVSPKPLNSFEPAFRDRKRHTPAAHRESIKAEVSDYVRSRASGW